MRRFRHQRLRIVIFLLVFAITGGVLAGEVLGGERCQVGPDQVIEGDLFAFCGEMLIEGRVEGNVFGAARSVEITGEVTGGVYTLAGDLDFSGTVGKDLNFIGLILDIRDDAKFVHEQGSVISVSLSVTLDSGAPVPGNISDLGYQLIINGDVGGEVNFWGSAFNLSGTVGGNVNATVGNAESNGAASQIETLLIPFPFEVGLIDPGLIIFDEARIEGQLDYRAAVEGLINDESLENPPIFRSTRDQTFNITEPTSAASIQHYISELLREFATLGFVSFIFLLILPRQIQSPLRYMQGRPVSTLGVGMLSFLMSFPIVLMMALFSIMIMLVLSLLPIDTVVIISGLVLVLVNIGLASIFYFTAIYVARIVVALAIGRFVMKRILHRFDGSFRSLFFSLMLGDILLAFATSIPVSVVSWGINALAAFLGLGAILILFQDKLKAFLASTPGGIRSRAAYATTLGSDGPLPRRLPAQTTQMPLYPRTIDEEPEQLGMDNLPRGFDWWGEED